MEDLKKIREKITEIDNQMAQLFEARMRQVAKVAEYKRQNGLPIYDPKRENEVIAKGEARVADPELKSYYGQFLRDVMAVSRRYQARLLEGLRVAYCGTEGAFAHIAASRIFPMGKKIAYSGFPKAYEAVVQGACDCAVLPVENSFAGDVDQVNDLMFTGPLHINGMYDLAVTHDLLTVPGATMDDIKTVVSHPQALSQCANFIREHELEEVEYSNTALAAAYVREQNDRHIAAIGSAESAKMAGLSVLASGINDDRSNTTRFAVFSAADSRTSGNNGNTFFSLVFTARNEAGALAEALSIIGRHGFNMRTLRSRPMKDLLWQYYFYVEAAGDIYSPNGQACVEEMKSCCDKIKIVGAYNALSAQAAPEAEALDARPVSEKGDMNGKAETAASAETAEKAEGGTLMKIDVKLGHDSYPIWIARGLLAEAGQHLNLKRRVLVVTDDGVPARYAQQLLKVCEEEKGTGILLTLPQGEASKTLANFERICRVMLEHGFTRKDCVTAVGGGVIGDLAGFAAACYMRGVDFYNIPTTLLAQVDSSVGGKTAVDLGGIKNIVGAFHQPRAVLIDPEVLKTLDARQFACGAAEIIKMAATFDADLFARIEANGIRETEAQIETIIADTLRIKARVVEEDEKEQGLRKALNFGHTLGHGIESVSGRLLHGECVALGMLPMAESAVRERLRQVLQREGLPTACAEDADAVCGAAMHDKKADGDTVTTICVRRIGEFDTEPADKASLKQKYEEVFG